MWKADEQKDVVIASLMSLSGELKGRMDSLSEWSNICNSLTRCQRKGFVDW
jgi:hypothetical protein